MAASFQDVVDALDRLTKVTTEAVQQSKHSTGGRSSGGRVVSGSPATNGNNLTPAEQRQADQWAKREQQQRAQEAKEKERYMKQQAQFAASQQRAMEKQIREQEKLQRSYEQNQVKEQRQADKVARTEQRVAEKTERTRLRIANKEEREDIRRVKKEEQAARRADKEREQGEKEAAQEAAQARAYRSAKVASGAYAAMSVAAAAGTNFRDPYQTNGQGLYNTLQSVPGLGHLMGFGADIGGRTSRMDQAGVQAQKITALSQGEMEKANLRQSLGERMDASGARSNVLGGAKATLFNFSGDRMSAKGAEAYKIAKQMYPIQAAQAEAEREQTIAVKERVAEQNRLVKLEKEGVRLQNAKASMQAQMDSGTGRFIQTIRGDTERAGLASGIVDIEGMIQANKRQQERSTMRIGELKVGEAEKTGARRGAGINILKGQLNVTEGQIAGAEGTAQRLGSLGVQGRRQAKQAFDDLVAMGFDNADPETISLARQYDPAAVAEMERKSGAGSSEYRQGVSAGRVDFHDIQGKYAERDEQVNTIAKEELANQAIVAKSANDAIDQKLVDAMMKLVDDRFASIMQMIDEQRTARATR